MKQCNEALVRANEVRYARAELKREVKAGKASVGELLAEVELPDWLHKMPLDELLDALPRFQQKEIERIYFETPIKGGALIGDLTYRKRRLVADRVAKWEARQKANADKRAGRAVPRAAGEGSSRSFKMHHGVKGKVLG